MTFPTYAYAVPRCLGVARFGDWSCASRRAGVTGRCQPHDRQLPCILLECLAAFPREVMHRVAFVELFLG